MFDAISFLFGAYYAYVSLARDDLLAVRNHFPLEELRYEQDFKTSDFVYMHQCGGAHK